MINPSYWSYVHQLNAIELGHHLVGIDVEVLIYRDDLLRYQHVEVIPNLIRIGTQIHTSLGFWLPCAIAQGIPWGKTC